MARNNRFFLGTLFCPLVFRKDEFKVYQNFSDNTFDVYFHSSLIAKAKDLDDAKLSIECYLDSIELNVP